MLSTWVDAFGFTLLPNVGVIFGSQLHGKRLLVGMQLSKKPSWCPPNWVFSPIWTTVYTSWGLFSYTCDWYPIIKTAAYLMVPYLAWLSLASALNCCVWRDSKDKDDSND
ncbi:translocator protein-like [Hemiscyllium ocellatum]|uniref:translocator protein-like n=1 Tax=Hemiscyllium ocellatum TaxID=170820 RepID=UPI0029676AC4|nr:translocator protein-like [Hemiscyllium ocellatum]